MATPSFADWQSTLDSNFKMAQSFQSLQDWTSNGVSPSGCGDSNAYNSNYLPKKADGSASMWGYWNNKGPTCQVTPVSGTFVAGETVRSNTSATLVFQKYWTIGGQTYMQFATSPASGKFNPGDTLTGMTSSACAKMVAWPKIIGDHGTAYNWAGHSKSLMMNMGDNDNDANAMKGVGAQRLGLFFGDGVTGKSGLKKAYLFMMMKFPPNFFSMATSTTYNYVGFLKMWDMCPGFTSINYFGTSSEHATVLNTPDNTTEYGATGGSLVQLQGGGLSNASTLFFNNLASNATYSGGYWQYLNGAVTKMDVNGASDLQTYAQSGDWFGIEYAFDVGTLGNSDGTSELWIYDKNGVQKGYVAVNGQLNLTHFDHYVNKIVLGGNRRSGGTTTSTLDGRYFVDDVIIDGNRIGPKYFQLLSAYNSTATSGSTTGTTSGSTTGTTSGSTTGTTSGSTTGTTSTGLVAAYSFDEGTGTTVADKSGNGNNGTLSNTTWTTGKYGNALSFNGTNSMVTIPDSASLHLSTGMTLEAWVMPTNISSIWQDVIYKGTDAFYLEATSPTYSEPAGSANSSSSYRTYGTSALTANTWSHLALTFDGSTTRLYVNGVLVSSKAQSVAIPSSTSPLQIGGDSLYGEWFSGKIDEVRVYNKALTQTQIQSDMQTALSTTTTGSTSGTSTAGLVAAYSFNEGSGTTVADKSGNGNNGTLSNTTWTTGKFGNALSFNGTSSMVNIPDSASLHLSTGMTLEAWVMPTNISSVWQDVIYKGNDAFYLEATSPTYAEPAGSAYSGTSYRAYGTSSLTANTWSHLALTFDGSTTRLYVNGALVSSKAQSVAIPSSTSPLQIGGDSLYGEWFSGKIDEVRVYNKALTQTQIQTDMQTAL